MVVKKPSVALKSILQSFMGAKASTALPTNLSILRDETTGLLITTPTEVVMKIVQMQTVALSPDPTLPPGALFPWLGHFRSIPASSIPMISKQTTLDIMQEIFHRAPNYKAAGPDGDPGLIFKHMPPSLNEALRLLF